MKPAPANLFPIPLVPQAEQVNGGISGGCYVAAANRQGEWASLLEAAESFRALAPWEWLSDWPPLGLVDPLTGQTGFASVLGAAGEEFGLWMFQGPTGLWGILHFVASFPLSPWDGPVVKHHLNALGFSLGSRDEVGEPERRLYRKLGYSFRGRLGWPVFSRFEPGYAPSPPSGDDVTLLARWITLATSFAERLREDDLLRHEWETRTDYDDEDTGPCRILCLMPAGGDTTGRPITTPLGPGVLAWRSFTPESPVQLDGSFDFTKAAQYRRTLPRKNRSWEFEICPVPMLVRAPSGRSLSVQVALCVEEQTGFVIGYNLVAGPDPAFPADNLLKFVESAGYIPAEIGVTRMDVGRCVYPLTEALGISLVPYEHLPYLDEAYDSLVDFLQKGS